ncbi:MAG: ORF6N domain-containing protein, partial [Candidatus Omnitrophica bacterium]|nr:ORF6N domain-containing protein [Candidatus Omnitrophota bacterium]
MLNSELVARIESRIFQVRGRRVMLDSDLAMLYGVETKYLTRQVKRNLKRFPEDFMFRLTPEEFLRCQKVTSKRGGRRYLPYAFTEEGVAMLSSVLNSGRAIMVNIHIMRAFVNLRRISLTYVGLKRKIEGMEKKYDEEFKIVFTAFKKLIEPQP